MTLTGAREQSGPERFRGLVNLGGAMKDDRGSYECDFHSIYR
jgi:hypothetical protein